MAYITGTQGYDTLDGTADNDTVVGSGGYDTVKIDALLSVATFHVDKQGRWVVRTPEGGQDVLRSIEFVQFNDATLRIDPLAEDWPDADADPTSNPAISPLAGGGIGVAWHGSPSWTTDAVFVQRYHANGSRDGALLEIGTSTESTLDPVIAGLADGGLIVVWTLENSLSHEGEILAQRLDGSGALVGETISVNQTMAGDQSFASVAALPDGGFVAAWNADMQDGSEYGVFIRQFDSAGNPLSDEARINTWTTGSQTMPDIATLADGGWILAWQSAGQDGSGSGIYMQRFGADGAPLGDETRVNTTTEGNQEDPAVSGLSDGGFVVAWESPTGIYWQRFDANGNAAGAETRADRDLDETWYDYSAIDPDVAGLADGGFAVVWDLQSYDSSEYETRHTNVIRRYDENGLPREYGFQIINHSGESAAAPAIAPLPDGGVAVAHHTTWYGAYPWTMLSLVPSGGAISGSVGDDIIRLTGTRGALIWGQQGNDTLTGSGSNDRLDGGFGADLLSGGAGNDVYFIDNMADQMRERTDAGDDLVISTVSWELGKNVEHLLLDGDAGISGHGNLAANVITGNSAANHLEGKAGADTINGAAGNDTVSGGLGSDVLTGGSGADVFLFDTRGNAVNNLDRITDFEIGIDRILLASSVYTGLTQGTLDPAAFHTTPFASDADDRLLYDITTGILYYDADGSGSGYKTRIAILDNSAALTAADFLVT